MILPGLCSISFRRMSPSEIVDLVSRAQLTAIEWGGDVHVPHGDVIRAKEVGELTENAGLKVSSYGSYYYLGDDDQPVDFEAVVQTASALGAPTVRVWVGREGSDQADRAYVERIVQEARDAGDAADAVGIKVAFEFHGGSLTDTPESTKALLEKIDHENVGTYWQMPIGATEQSCRAGLESLLPWLINLHAFWLDAADKPLLLDEGFDSWRGFLATAATTGRDHYVLKEYVKDDSPDAFLQDAATLSRLVETL